MNFSFIGKTFAKGLIVLLPILITVYLIVWLGKVIDGMLSPVVGIVSTALYLPGSGIVLAIIVVFAVGVLMNAEVGRRLVRWAESIVEHIPLVSSLYGSLRDLIGMFRQDKKNEMQHVVMVDLGGGRGHVIGFVTRESFDDLPEGVGGANDVAVYLPMSYQLGGYTAIVPRDSLKPVDMGMEQAMKFALTAGVKSNSDHAGSTKST